MPTAPSSLQSEASRTNGARSQGPTTPAGKARSSRNAIRHGLRGGAFELLPHERPHAAALRLELMVRWLPIGAVELDAVEALLTLHLRKARLDALELKVLAAALEREAAGLPSLATLTRYRRSLERQREEAEASLTAAATARLSLPPRVAALTPTTDTDEPEVGTPGPTLDRPAPAAAAAEPQAAPLNRAERRRLQALQRKQRQKRSFAA